VVRTRPALGAALSLLLTACASPEAQREQDHVRDALLELESRPPVADTALVGTLTLADVIAYARARSPELLAGRARARAALERVERAGSLAPPVLEVMGSGVPIRRPTAYNDDFMDAAGVRQDFPFPGKLANREAVALGSAREALEGARARENDLVLEVSRAFLELYASGRDHEIHLEHMRLTQDLVAIAESRYARGAVPEADVLRGQSELARFHALVVEHERMHRAAMVALNQLLDRAVDAPLGRPVAPPLPEEPIARDGLEARGLARRPELAQASAAVRRSERQDALARKDALLPDFSVALDYWYQPTLQGLPLHAYAWTVNMSLPWIWGGLRAEERAAAAELEASQAEKASAERKVSAEVRDAALRAEARREIAWIHRRELVPMAQKTLAATRSSYEKGSADFLSLIQAERDLREAEIDAERALALFAADRADLERATGEGVGDREGRSP
jgi:outer membrane protein TolC